MGSEKKRGYIVSAREQEERELAAWEKQAADAIGNSMEFWGFKRNHGRLWTCLYLRNEPMTALELQHVMELSKGAVSMITRELERWGVIHRVRTEGHSSWHFVAETDLRKMISRVLAEREADMLSRIQEDLRQARELALEEEASEESLKRLDRVECFARMVSETIQTFASTGRMNLMTLANLFLDGSMTLFGKNEKKGSKAKKEQKE